MTSSVPWMAAWQSALYAPGGFFRASRPGEHFRTSAQVGQFALAIAELARRTEAASVVDMAAGGGELLRELRSLLPDIPLTGVELAARPLDLDPSIGWLPSLPDHIDGLLIANEWLDNVPCPVVEVDELGAVREVWVDPATGAESLGPEVNDPWLDAWWPIAEPGMRAEIGRSRDEAWANAVTRVDGLAVAIDYGHLANDRPPFGSLRSYLSGSEVDVIPDASRDVTAHVAVDSVAKACQGQLRRQRDALAELGVDGARPPIDLAHSDPAAYVRALAHASESGELTAAGGLGDFWWIVTDTTGRGRLGT